jgi:hypothetical protein
VFDVQESFIPELVFQVVSFLSTMTTLRPAAMSSALSALTESSMLLLKVPSAALGSG